MRLGNKKRICFRTNRGGKRKISGFLCVVLALAVFFAGALYYMKSMRPMLVEVARSKAESVAIDVVNSAVADIFSKNPVSYTELVKLEKDGDGRIRALQSDLSAVNRLKADVSLAIQQKIAALSETEIFIPAGAMSGVELLAGLGPRLRVRLLPYGDTRAEFESTFESVAINQTRLSVNLRVKTSLALLMPIASATCEIEEALPVAQTVLVGDAPDSYFQVDRSAGSLADDALELAPTP